MAKQKILIAGAGLGGLAAAACMLKAGHDVEVYEQAPALGEVGAGIQVSANAMHVLRHLGLGPQIDKNGVQPGAYVFRMYDTGELIQEFPLSADHEKQHGAPYTQMHRADFHEMLANKTRELKSNAIHLNKRVAGFTENESGVELNFTDGTSAKGDMLIGADGLKSMVRRQIAGDAPATYTGDAAWRVTVPVERLPENFLDKVMSLFIGGGGHCVCYYVRGGKLLNFVGIVETDDVQEESWTVKMPWEQLKADFKGWHPIVQRVLDEADHDQCYRWSLFYRPPIKNWSTKRATLLGDSAHATLPYLAQGAAMAIEDGMVLTRALDMTPTVADALQLYQRNRIDRTAKIVTQSTDNRRLFHLRSREEVFAEFGKRNEGEDRNKWLYSYNPLTVELK
jgi:salicylate hydroxylase